MFGHGMGIQKRSAGNDCVGALGTYLQRTKKTEKVLEILELLSVSNPESPVLPLPSFRFI